MKLKRVEIQDCRGIRNLELNPEGENLVVWGYNGTGKSAIVDAIEFLLTGSIQRLRGSGTQGITLTSHGPHTDADPADAKVRATIQVSSDETITLTRTMDAPGDISITGNEDANIDGYLQAAADRHFLLTRKDILAFIQDTDQGRAKQMEELLDLEDVEQTRRTLQSAARTAEESSDSAAASVQTAENRLAQLLGLDEFNEDEAVQQIDNLREELGADPLSALDEDRVREGIEEPPQADEDEERDDDIIIGEAARALLDATEADEEWVEKAEALDSYLEELQEDPGLQDVASRKRLLELGAELVGETDECPLCNEEWEPEALEAHVQSCLEDAEEGSHLLNQIDSAATSLRQPASQALAAIGEFEDETENLETPIDLEDAKEALEETQTFLQSPATSHEAYDRDVTEIPTYLSLREYREELQDLISDEPGDEDGEERTEEPSQIEIWETLTRAEDRLESLREAEQKKMTQEEVELRAVELYNTFLQARDDELEDLYESLSSRFSELYEKLHGPDEDDFDATLNQTETGVEMVVPFYGRGPYPPNALHSEGHQDSMGLCLFFALREHLPGESIPVVLLDDVVMSIDAGHRREVARLLREEFDDLQMIITTHDKNWARQLRTEGVVTRTGRIDLYNWDVETGPTVNTVGDFMEKVRQEVEQDVNAAAARLRRGAEAYFADVCNSLQAKVVYDNRRRWTLEDFLPAAVSKMGDLLAGGKRWASQTGNDDAMSMLQEMDDQRGEATRTLNLEQWALNPAVHYSRWEDLAPDDLREVIDAVEKLFQVFSCDECDSQLRVILDDYEVAGVACAEKCTSWYVRYD